MAVRRIALLERLDRVVQYLIHDPAAHFLQMGAIGVGEIGIFPTRASSIRSAMA
jgi:hypothetical protein